MFTNNCHFQNLEEPIHTHAPGTSRQRGLTFTTKNVHKWSTEIHRVHHMLRASCGLSSNLLETRSLKNVPRSLVKGWKKSQIFVTWNVMLFHEKDHSDITNFDRSKSRAKFCAPPDGKSNIAKFPLLLRRDCLKSINDHYGCRLFSHIEQNMFFTSP